LPPFFGPWGLLPILFEFPFSRYVSPFFPDVSTTLAANCAPDDRIQHHLISKTDYSSPIRSRNLPFIYPTQSDNSGGWMSTSHHEGPGSIPGQSVGFVSDEVALGHTIHRVRRPSLSASCHQASTHHFIHPSLKLCNLSDRRRLQVTQLGD